MAVAYRISMLATLYIHIFKHFLHDSLDGVLIVNDRGKILYSNNQFLQILNLPHAPTKGDYFETAF
ncbi:MAG: PAS domain-containing protein, partial [Nitrosopumilaceae archaeon]|nr:PAS domain-containing protein [Nitrosopumilaceae archaeon]NIU87448.1 PAS domain-containing protein [Nitrosopumilaceae archaeon]NIX61611.1 PAS domain-containing protein [Nitrosopumilaceae archaeon]